MMRLIDTWIPWLADLLELGGPILFIVLLSGLAIGTLLFERIYFTFAIYPHILEAAKMRWAGLDEHSSWFSQQRRTDLIMTLDSALQKQFPLVRTLIKVCPLLGLLGTVLGMLEVFDALAATGSNNPRSMAAGVSKATVSTLAGMVVAIVGLLGLTLVERRAGNERERLPAYFESTDD